MVKLTLNPASKAAALVFILAALGCAPVLANPAPNVAAAVPPQAIAAPTSAATTLDARFDAFVRNAQLPQAGLIVIDSSGVLYERRTSGFSATTSIPIASASKWVAAALIMTAIDRGEMSLDDTVGKFIPEAPLALKSVTLRQLLSHTSGMAGRAISQLRQVSSLEDSVLKLIAEPMVRAPGAAFSYGGTSMQVAGLMLERAAKKPFSTLFSERIAIPLGMTGSRFGSPRTWGTGEVPMVGGGMAMSLDDYRRFLAMMLANGQVAGQRILSETSIAAIETNMIAGLSDGYRPRAAAANAGYGLGVWCEDMDANRKCGLVSSAGAFGAYPWLDRKSGRAGFFLTRSTLAKVYDDVRILQETTKLLPGRPTP